ncbi:hypothetical protein GP486_004325 [Trichoglossum hirsutum]|uniref:Alpha-type protein kinase domain-containing protein n=1 Tax=Trichoglossum hirsutum TaxID=265104 RepID=A0A9P8LBJ9_9PEZI|nr:hypothetical protein GP486_004325 [Trichoglossum hirsutum]
MASPPSNSRSVSMSRSRATPDDIRSAAEAMLQSSLSRNRSSSSSIATTLPPYPGSGRSTSSTITATSSRRTSVGPGLSTAQVGVPAATQWPSSRSSSTLASATSATRERLRLAELERDELRRAMDGERAKASEMRRLAEEERAVAERLKREGGATGISAVEATLRALQLDRDMRKAAAESPRRPTTGLFREACSTDLLFLIDTTGSMAPYINAAKEQVKSIVNDIKLAFLNEAEVRIAVVGYKDHEDSPNIQFLDFTPSADRVREFLNELTATGGGDAPEDVLGGIQQAINATWKQQTRCIIHIADAPPHGHTFHDSPEPWDRYPVPGCEPHGLTHEPLLRQLVGLKINYALLRINNTTDRTAFTFSQAYAAASAACKLHKSNRYCSQAEAEFRRSFPGGRSSKSSAKAVLQFEEAALGTTYSALRHLVLKSVTTSASRTAFRMSVARANPVGLDKKLDINLAAIEEDEDDADDAKLEKTPPRWDTPGWLNETLMVEGFSPDVVVHSASTLNDMMAHDDNIKMSITELTIHKRSQPFAQGAMRVASYARMSSSTNHFVVKSFKRGGKRLAHLAEDMRCQALCKAFALEFSALAGEQHSIDFIVTTCLKGKSGTASGDDCMSLEPFIGGAYVKYNNNCGYVNEEIPGDQYNQAAQAFSHFTFERSQGRFMVSDLQGVGNLLTDPAIHTLDLERFKLVDTNLGMDGFKFFFATHTCNNICRKLGLKSSAATLMSGTPEFRATWPSMDNTVCCSNKMCGRIVRLAKAKKSIKFPGYHWCNTCWPQLRSYTVKLICVAPGTHHEFEVSKFFYASQGRTTPRKCPIHREGDDTLPRSAVVSGNLWSRLRYATKKSNSGRSP